MNYAVGMFLLGSWCVATNWTSKATHLIVSLAIAWLAFGAALFILYCELK